MKFEKMARLIEIVSYARGFCEVSEGKEVTLMLEEAIDILMEEIQEVINTQKRSVV